MSHLLSDDDDDPFASPAPHNANTTAAAAAPISARLLPAPPPPMPAAPSPLRMEGYLRKLKSDESKLGALFSRSKFNKRWFAIEEKSVGAGADESTEAMLAQFGPLYELKYWKASSDVGLKLPSFSLDLSAIRGVGEGVGRGPFTREAHAFHVETLDRTYVLTASKREEMEWWLRGLAFYVWQHNETVRRIESAEHEAAETARTGRSAAAGVMLSPGRDDFASAAAADGAGAPAPSARRRSLPGQVGVADLGSPVSSSEGGSALTNDAGSPSPLPAFSPLAAQDPMADDRLRVELKPFGLHDGGLQSLRLSGTFGAGAADRSAREAAAAAQLDDDEIEEELEHKYDGEDDGAGAAETNDTARAYPSMHDDHSSASDDPFAALHNEASAPPQTDRAGVPVRSALVASPFEAALSPHIDASAPPQTDRPAAASPAPLPAKVAAVSSPSATNPHARSPVAAAASTAPAATDDDDDDDPFAAHHDEAASPPPSLGHTAGEESFHVVMSNVSPSHAAVAAAVAETAYAAPSARETNGETNRSEDPFSTHGAIAAAAIPAQLSPPPRTPDDDEQEDLVRSELARPGGRSSRRSGGEASAADDHDHASGAAEDASSLGPEDESIMNGSTMLAESTLHIEGGEPKAQFKPPPGVPSINPAGAGAGAVAAAKKSTVVHLPPITQAQPATSSPAASATPLAIKADIASAALPAPAAAPARSGFTPSNSSDCHTALQFATLRQELRAYGVERLIADQVAAGWFATDAATGAVRVSDAPKPFNPFARLVTGALAAPYGNLLQRFGLPAASDTRFFVAQNRPELAAQWASADQAWLGKASMGQHHEFLLLRDLQWSCFNVSTFGLMQSGGGAESCTAASLRQALTLLDDIESTARAYTRAAGWSENLGLFFHAYPFNSVQALHCHMLDLDCTGPTFEHLNHKNLSLDSVRSVIRNELDAMTPPPPAAGLTSTLGTTQPGQSSPSSDLPPDSVQVALRLDADFSATAAPAWQGSFVAEMARALSVSPTRLRVLSVRAGSILVDLAVLPGYGVADAPAAQVVAELQRQSADAQSALRKGSITGAIREIKVTSSSAAATAVATTPSPAPSVVAHVPTLPVLLAKSLTGAPSGFKPSGSCCTDEAAFARLRAELRSYGVARVLADQVALGVFLAEPTGALRVNDASGSAADPVPVLDSNGVPILRALGMVDADRRYFVAQSPAGDSGSKPHHVVVSKSAHWSTFNVSLFGMDLTHGRLADLQAALDLLDEIESIVRDYAARELGGEENVAALFEAFPFTSARNLQCHMIELDPAEAQNGTGGDGGALAQLHANSLSLGSVRNVLVREMKQIAPGYLSRAEQDPTKPPLLLRAKTVVASDATDTELISPATAALRYTASYTPAFVPKTKFTVQPGAMQVRVWVSVALRELTRDASWLSAFLIELSSALRISPHRLAIVCVDPESKDESSRLIVTLTILPKQAEHELEPHEIAEGIRAQVSDAQSPLRRGRIGSKATKVRVVASAEQQHVHHQAELHGHHTPRTPARPIAASHAPAAANSAAAQPALAVSTTAASHASPSSLRSPHRHGHRGSVSWAGDSSGAAVPAAAPAAHWKSDLSSLLQSDKLPYEDVPTHRSQPPQPQPQPAHAHNHTVTPAASRAHAHLASLSSSRPASSAASGASATPLATCDQCFSAITTHNIAAASYNWSSHVVLCGRCQAATTHQQRVAAPLREPLANFLANQADAYCTHHALPAPVLPSPFIASPGSTPIRLGVRARALRFTGLLSSYCDGCAVLLCDQCRAEDGVHHPGTAHAVQSLSTQHSRHAGKLAGLIKSQVLPKRAELLRGLQSLQALREQAVSEEQAVRAETLRAREESLSSMRLRCDRVKHEAALLEDTLTEQLRQLDLADEMMQQQHQHPASTQTPASMCAFLAQAPSLIEQSRAIFAAPHAQAASASSVGSYAADGYATAPPASAGVTELLQSLRREQEAILSDRKDNEDKIQAVPSLESAISAKDRDLASILASRRGLVASSAAQAHSLNDLYTRAHGEINEWMSMTEGMAATIAQMKQTCTQCGVALSAAAANTRCSAARSRGLGLHAFVPTAQTSLE